MRYRALCPTISQASSIRRALQRKVSHSIPPLRCSQACVRIFSPMRALAHRHQSGSLHEALCPPSQPQFAPQPPCESPAPSRAALCDASCYVMASCRRQAEGRALGWRVATHRLPTHTADDRQQTTVGGALGPGCLGPPRAATRAMHLGMQTFVAHSICWVRVLAICPCDLYSCLRAWGLGCACIVCACARCAAASCLTSIHVCLRLYKRMCLQSKHMTRIVWLTLVHQSARRSSSYSVQTVRFDVVA